MKKSILFVMETLGSGGAERSLVNLLTMLGPDKYKIDLLLFNKTGVLVDQVPSYVNWIQPAKEMLFLSSSLRNNKIFYCFTLKCALLRLLRIISSIFKKNRCSYHKGQLQWQQVWNKCVPELSTMYDVAVAYLQGLPSYYVIDKVQAKRKLLWIHCDYSKYEADIAYDNIYFSKADNIVTISEICKDALCEAFPSLQNKFKILYNINSSTVIRSLAEQPMPKEYVSPKENKTPILLSIGRLEYAKGFDMAIEAAALLRKHGVVFYWFIIGEGSLRKTLQTQITKNAIENQVFLLGIRNNPYSYIKHSDLVVQTSRYEGKSIVLDEAKILCKAIVSTKYNSVFDQIDDGKSGILVDISSEGIAEGIERLLKDKSLQEQFSNNLALMDCDTKKELQRYIDCFEGKLG